MANPLFDLLRLVDALVPSGAGELGASALVVAAVFVVRLLTRRVRQSLASDPDASARRLLISATRAGLTGVGVLVFIGIWGLLGPLYTAYRNLGLTEVGTELILTAVLLVGAYVVTDFVGRFIEEVASSRDRVTEHQREVLYRVTQVGLYTVVGLIVVTLFTRNIGSLLVGAGFLGIIVGMAARQTLGSVIAGFVLMFSRPFEIGDWVEIDGREGIVTEITVVDTRIQTFDGEYLILPNDTVSGSSVVNRTRRGRLRVEVEVGVDYAADPERAATVARDAVTGLDELLTVPTPQVLLKRFGDSSVVLGVRGWIGRPSARRRWRARTAIVSAVKDAFEEEGIKIPFPQRELAGREETGGFVLAGDPVGAPGGASRGDGQSEAAANDVRGGESGE